MTSPQQALAERIRTLRRRHFGPRGKTRLAELLNLSIDEYERFERGTVPTGDVLIRLCEVTGEDLQWLLTGVAARSTMVITSARGRHQESVARLAQLLESRPELAPAIDAFLDLLSSGPPAPAQMPARALPAPDLELLVPILDPGQLPLALPGGPDGGDGGGLVPALARTAERRSADLAARRPSSLFEPAAHYAAGDGRAVDVLTLRAADGSFQTFLHDSDVKACLPGAFGVRLIDGAMAPMFETGDAAIATLGVAPRVGRPAICRLVDEGDVRCRVWLGQDAETVHLGRVADGGMEDLPASRILWSLEVLFRLAAA